MSASTAPSQATTAATSRDLPVRKKPEEQPMVGNEATVKTDTTKKKDGKKQRGPKPVRGDPIYNAFIEGKIMSRNDLEGIAKDIKTALKLKKAPPVALLHDMGRYRAWWGYGTDIYDFPGFLDFMDENAPPEWFEIVAEDDGADSEDDDDTEVESNQA